MMGEEGARDIFEFDRLMLDTPYTVIRDRRLKELEWADDLCSRIAIRYVISPIEFSTAWLNAFFSIETYEAGSIDNHTISLDDNVLDVYCKVHGFHTQQVIDL